MKIQKKYINSNKIEKELFKIGFALWNFVNGNIYQIKHETKMHQYSFTIFSEKDGTITNFDFDISNNGSDLANINSLLDAKTDYMKALGFVNKITLQVKEILKESETKSFQNMEYLKEEPYGEINTSFENININDVKVSLFDIGFKYKSYPKFDLYEVNRSTENQNHPYDFNIYTNKDGTITSFSFSIGSCHTKTVDINDLFYDYKDFGEAITKIEIIAKQVQTIFHNFELQKQSDQELEEELDKE